MTTIHAIGYDPGSAYTPTLSISEGDDEQGVQVLFREQDEQETRSLSAFFDARQLFQALSNAVEISRQSGLKAAA